MDLTKAGWKPVLVSGLAAFAVLAPAGAQAQLVSSRFTSGGRELVSLSFADASAGVPAGVTLQSGSVQVVTKDGQPMLRASSRTSLLVQLPEVLPQNFTLEFDIIPKTCCQPEDLAVEGTPEIDQGPTSANVLWWRDILAVIGGAVDNYNGRMPEPLAATLPGAPTNIVLSVQGDDMTLFTNGRQVLSLTGRKFARGRVLRVFLGGQNDTDRAVFLSRLRVTADAVSPLEGTSPTTAQQTAILEPSVTSGTGSVVPADATRQPLKVERPRTAPTVLSDGPAPTSISVSGTPTTATVTWSPVSGATGYRVNRAVAGATWTSLTADPITATSLADDALPDFRQTYTYQVLAYQAGGQFGAATADYTPPPPEDPRTVTATIAGSGVRLTWPAAPYAAAYLVSGPGVPSATQVTGTSFSLAQAPTGLNVYQVASVFAPGGVLTPASAWPSAVARIAPQPTIPFLTTRNGLGSAGLTLRHYDLPAYCGTGNWETFYLSCTNVFPNAGPRTLKELLAWWMVGEGPPTNPALSNAEWLRQVEKWERDKEAAIAATFGESVALADTADLGVGRRIWCGAVRREASILCLASSHGAAAGSPGFNDPARNGDAAALNTQSKGFTVIVKEPDNGDLLAFHAFAFPPGYDPDAEPDPAKRWVSQLNNAYAVNGSGAPAETTFDTQGPKPAPQSCLACHGGRFNSETGKVAGGSLLPVDPARVVFANRPGYSRAEQEPKLARLNATVKTRAPAMVIEYVNGLYANGASATTVDDFVPPGWSSQAALWRAVIRPYCSSCHMAQEGPLSFSSFADVQLLKDRVQKSVCGDGTMPHAELPFRNFWNNGGPVFFPGLLSTLLGFSSCP